MGKKHGRQWSRRFATSRAVRAVKSIFFIHNLRADNFMILKKMFYFICTNMRKSYISRKMCNFLTFNRIFMIFY